MKITEKKTQIINKLSTLIGMFTLFAINSCKYVNDVKQINILFL